MGNFEENRKFIGLNGVIGRRDFIINFLIIEIIEGLIFTTPVLYFLLLNPENAQYFEGGVKPFWFVVGFALTGLISVVFYFSSFVRRIRDITGQEDNNKIYLISSILAVFLLATYTPVGNFYMIRWLGLFILISLMFIKGKITGEKPKSEIIKFNWGAFFGTWIWGIFNKIPLTLLVLPLLFTTSWFPFMMICALKGNEWTYNKNRTKYQDVDTLHSSQQNQAIIFVITAPIISLILSVIMAICGAYLFIKYAQQNPQVKQKFIDAFKNYNVKAIEASFEKITKNDKTGEYEFYIEPNNWQHLQNTAFRNAVNYAAIKDGNYDKIITGDIRTNYETLNEVKIYSTFNNETLAECDYSQKDILKIEAETNNKNGNLRQLLNNMSDRCKFNNNPTQP